MATSVHKVDISWDRHSSGTVAKVVFDNARRLNVLNPPALLDLTEAFLGLAREDDLRCVVLSGAGGRAFIGGADINYMATMKQAEDGRRFITMVHQLCQAIRDCPVPVICRMEGYTLGAGLEVAAACDIRIAADNAHFGMPEVRVGIPSVVEAALLPQLIGYGRTRRLLLTGVTIDAEEALAWGLVDAVAPPDRLDTVVERFAGTILAGGSNAIRLQKRLIREWEDLSATAAIARGIDCFVEAFDTDEPTRLAGARLAEMRARRGNGAA
jgi:enoyl-CoA hydratase/carnithine racemase